MKFIFTLLNSTLCWLFICADTVFWGLISITSALYNPSGRVAHYCMRSWSRDIL